MTRTPALILALVVMGAGWGATMPLTRIAVSTGHHAFGLIFWQTLIGAVVLAGILAALRLKPRFGRVQIAFAGLIALLGTILPNSASYTAAAHLPAGIMALVITTVPLMAFPVALALGTDRFGWTRLFGLILGIIGVAILAGPRALPDAAMILWLPVALIAPLLYAVEGNVVARWGTFGLDAISVLFGASIIGAVVALPLALATGTWVDPLAWGAPEKAIVVNSVIHAIVYSAYVWMISAAGAVFAAQVGYLVTGFGVIWSMIFLGERYGPLVWVAMALMFAGLFLVQPRKPSLEGAAAG